MNKIFTVLAFYCLLTVQAIAQTCTPVVVCPMATDTMCDLSTNTSDLWSQTHWWSPTFQSHDLAEASTELLITATDTCAAGLTLHYLLFLDLDGDGTQETVVNSQNLPGTNTVYYDNANTPNYSGGTPKAFDARPIPPAEQYAFALQTTSAGNQTTARVAWHTLSQPGVFVNPQLPYGLHRIRWMVSNTLGQSRTCEQNILIADCKKPTVVCKNGISINLLPNQTIQIWATDFVQYAEDNASPSHLLQVAVRKTGVPDGMGQTSGFPKNADGSAQTSVTYTCQEAGMQSVEVWVLDQAGNADFCGIFLEIKDLFGNCHNLRISVCAVCDTATQPYVDDVIFTLRIQEPGGMADTVSLISAHACAAYYQNLPIPLGSHITVTPFKNSISLYGVSTYDMVLIARHLTGEALLDNPYKLIAADVNADGFVDAFDIFELRLLILGIYTELPDNTSWRFVPSDYQFPNENFPSFPPFPQSIQVTDTPDTLLREFLFQAIKVGDVNSTCGDNLTGAAEDRSVAALTLPDITLQAGQTFDLPLCMAEPGAWYGLQTQLQWEASHLEIVGITPGDLPDLNGTNFYQPGPGLLRLCWATGQPVSLLPDQPLATLRVRALAPVTLRESLHLTDTRLAPEAWDAALHTRPLTLTFLEKTSDTQDPAAALPPPPRPNPTTGGFCLPLRLTASGPVSVQVADLSGQVLYQKNVTLAGGTHLWEVPASALPHAGVYVWKVQAGHALQTGRVVKQ